MADKVQSGKIQLIVVLIVVVAIQIRIMVTYLIYIGADRVAIHGFRLLFISALCVLIYEKRRFAKWLLVGWFLFNIIQAVSKVEFTSNYLLIAMSLTYAVISIMLLFSPAINAFLESGKGK